MRSSFALSLNPSAFLSKVNFLTSKYFFSQHSMYLFSSLGKYVMQSAVQPTVTFLVLAVLLTEPFSKGLIHVQCHT